MRTVAFVPLRLNSKRVVGKNLLPFGDHALCWYVFRHLLDAQAFDRVYAFCSDESVMAHIPQGVEFLKRDAILDGDFIKGLQIYRAFCEMVHADIYALAHATSPFIYPKTYAKAVNAVRSGQYDSALSVEQKKTFCWFKGEPLNYLLTDVPRTQDLEPVMVETSGFFIFGRDVLLKHNRRIGFKPLLQEVSPLEALDIDNPEDLELGRALVQTFLHTPHPGEKNG